MYTTVPLLASPENPFTSQFPLGISRSPCGQGSHACGFRGRLSGGLQLVRPTGSRPPAQTNRSAYGKPSLSPSPALPLPCPGARSRAAGRGRDRSPGVGALTPAGPRRGGHNFSACGSGRGRPAAKLSKRLAEISVVFLIPFSAPPALSANFRHHPARHGATPSSAQWRSGQRGGKETGARHPRRRRPPGAAVGGGPGRLAL